MYRLYNPVNSESINCFVKLRVMYIQNALHESLTSNVITTDK